MSIADIREACELALSHLSDAAITYRAVTTDAWTPLPTAILTADRPGGTVWDADEGGDVEQQTGSLTVSVNSPALYPGAQVKDWRGQVWSVSSDPARSAAVVFYRIKRMQLNTASTHDRGEER